MKARKMETVVEVLKHDHRMVEELFAKLEKAKGSSRKLKVFKTLKEEFMKHAAAEEKILYPRMKEVQELRDFAFEADEEHALAKYLFNELESVEPGSEVWDAKCLVLKELIEHHVEEEEDEIFPKLKKELERDELLALGDDIKVYKEQPEDSWDRLIVPPPNWFPQPTL